MKKIYTAAIVGTGRIGFTLGFDKKREQPASHTMALKNNPRAKIVAGVDCDEAARRLWQKSNPSATAFSSVGQMREAFRKNIPDIIVVAVNENAHLPVTLEVLSCKPRLLILEKPVALNLREAARIKAAAKRYGVPVLVNHERRFAFDWNLAADYLGKIGELQSIDARLFSGMRLYDPREEKSGAYSLLHDGTHLVDIVLFLLERAERGVVKKAGGAERSMRLLLKNPVLESVWRERGKKVVRNLSAHYSSKCCGDVRISMSGRSRFFGFEVDVVGTEGRVFVGNGFADFYRRAESKLYSGFYSLEKDAAVAVPKKGGRIHTGYFANMTQNAVDFLDGRAPLKSTLQTGINALRVLEELKQLIVLP